MSDAPGGIRAPMLALLCAALGSLLPAWMRAPIPLYDPIGRAWRIGAMDGAGVAKIEMTYYGVYICAALAGLIGAALGLALERGRPSPSAHPGLLPLWALCALLLAAAYQAFTLLA